MEIFSAYGAAWGWDNGRALLGLAAIVGLAWVLGGCARPRWRLIFGALGLQFALAVGLFAAEPVRDSLFAATAAVEALSAATRDGTSFVFGYVGGAPAPFPALENANTVSLAFQILPMVMVISALSAVLWRWRVLPAVTQAFAFVFRKTLGLSGAASLAVSANIFLGMVEAPILVRPHLAKLSRSEVFVIMTTGLATVAGTVLAIYAIFLSDVLPEAAGHIIAASIMSAPAAVLLGRLMVPPERDEAQSAARMDASPYPTTMSALTTGVSEGLRLYVNIIAMLLVFVALVGLVNGLFGLGPDVVGAPLSVERLFGWAFQPLMWLMGVPWGEAGAAGALYGVKTALNEFLAFEALAKAAGDGTLSTRSTLIMTYALCGFANFGGLGIMIAGLSTLMPERRDEVLALAPRSMVSGSLATIMTGCVVAATPAGVFGL